MARIRAIAHHLAGRPGFPPVGEYLIGPLVLLLVPALAGGCPEEARGHTRSAPFRQDARSADPEVELEVLREELPGGGRVERQVRRDDDGSAVNHGDFKSWYPDGTVEAVGRYADGKKVGKWETWHPNGEKRSLERYRRGLKNGEWRSWDENGKYLGKDRFEARFEVYPSGAPRWEGENLLFQRAIPHGVWRWFHEDGGLRCEGWYQRGTPVGHWTWFWWDGGVQYEGDFERVRVKGEWRSRRAGRWVFHHRNGCPDPGVLTGTFRDGARVPAESAEPLDADPGCGGELPEPTAWPGLGPETEEEIARLVARAMGGTDAQRVEAGLELEAWGESVVPSVLAALRTLDLGEPLQRRAAAEVWGLLPRGLLGGALDGWSNEDGPEAARANELARLRWLTFWELFGRDGDAFLALRGTGSEELERMLFGAEPGAESEWNTRPVGERAAPPADDVVQQALERAQAGGEGTEEALTRALDWLVAAQGDDGSWDGGEETTCFALLALSGVSSMADGGVYGEAVGRGVEWLLAGTRPVQAAGADRRPPGDPYRPALTVLTLADGVRRVRDPALRRRVQEHFDRLLKHRRNIGSQTQTVGFQIEDPRGAAWEVVALTVGHELGFRVNQDDLKWAASWVDPASERVEERRDVESVGLLLWARMLLGWDEPDSAAARRPCTRMIEALPDLAAWGDRDLLTWFHGTYALQRIGGEPWRRWNTAMKEVLLRTQRDDGSWGAPAEAERGVEVMRTALGALCLEVYFRFG